MHLEVLNHFFFLTCVVETFHNEIACLELDLSLEERLKGQSSVGAGVTK